MTEERQLDIVEWIEANIPATTTVHPHDDRIARALERGDVFITMPERPRMLDCVCCKTPFFSRSSANVVCNICRAESTADFGA